MEAPGRRWGCSRVEVLLIPSASRLRGSHADPNTQPHSGGVRTPLSRLLRARATVGSLGGQQGRASVVLLRLAWVGGGSRGEKGGIQGTPRQSRHKITHWSLWEPVALSPRHLVFFFFFWLFSGICCLFWETERKMSRWDTRLGWTSASRTTGRQQKSILACICRFAYIYLHIPFYHHVAFHATELTRQLPAFLKKEERSHKPTLRLMAGMYVLPGHYTSGCPG